MSVKATLRLNAAKIVVLSLSVLLAGCGSSGGGGGDGESSSTTSTEPSDVPLELITMEDPSAVVEAVSRGIDLDFQLLRTPFHCYYNVDVSGAPETDFSTPHVSIDFVGDSFTLTGILGDFTGSVEDDENNNRITTTFDGVGTVVSFTINFDIFGQWFQTDDSICFQSGASHERALHQFLLNTPEEGDFSCQASVNGSVPSDAGPLQLLSGNRYSYNQSEGTYRIAELFESNFSAFRFDTGGLAGFQGEYTENPNTGTQQFSVAEETTRQALNCSRQRPPRPFKRFGADIVPLPSASSEPISGDFYRDVGNSPSVGWAKFTAEGFIDLEYAAPGPSNCRRTLPNGLPPCISYTHNGGDTITLSRPAITDEVAVPFSIGVDGSVTSSIFGRYVPINPPTTSELIGMWRPVPTEDFDAADASLCLVTFCGPTTVSSETVEFHADGRFNFSSSSQSTTSISSPGIISNTVSQSQSSSAGVYQLEGSGIELRYDSGRIDPPVFLHLSDSNRLVFGRRVYQR